MNKVMLIGRLTKDPELKFTPQTGTAVCTFTLAVERRFRKEGQPSADFLPVVIWGKQAEHTANYCVKGKPVAVAGRIETRSYEAKDGGKRYVTEIIADEIQFLGYSKPLDENEDRKLDIPKDYFGNDMQEVPGEQLPF